MKGQGFRRSPLERHGYRALALLDSFREKLVEAVAETDDNLLEKYLDGKELSLEELTDGLR